MFFSNFYKSVFLMFIYGFTNIRVIENTNLKVRKKNPRYPRNPRFRSGPADHIKYMANTAEELLTIGNVSVHL